MGEVKFAGGTTVGYKAAQDIHAKLKSATPQARTQVKDALHLGDDSIGHFVDKYPGEHDHNTEHAAAAPASEGKADKSTPWGWIASSTAIGGATVGLVVWLIMHQHDKKMLAKLNQATTQN